MAGQKDSTKLAKDYELVYAVVTQLLSPKERSTDKAVKVNPTMLGAFLDCTENAAAVRWSRFKKLHTDGDGEDKHWIKPAKVAYAAGASGVAESSKGKKAVKHVREDGDAVTDGDLENFAELDVKTPKKKLKREKADD